MEVYVHPNSPIHLVARNGHTGKIVIDWPFGSTSWSNLGTMYEMRMAMREDNERSGADMAWVWQ
jgi:hypothetical protein